MNTRKLSKSKIKIIGCVLLCLIVVTAFLYYLISKITFSFESGITIGFGGFLLGLFKILVVPTKALILMILGFIWSSKEKDIVHSLSYWLFIVITGVTLIIISSFIFGIYSLPGLYDVLFPILRDAKPVITSVLLLSLFLRPLKKMVETIPFLYFRVFLLSILVLNVIFNKDILGFGNGSSITFVLLMVMLGMYMYTNYQQPGSWKILCRTIILIMSSGILFYLMSNVSGMLYKNQSASLRFSTTVSIFTVLLAVNYFHLFSGFIKRLSRNAIYLILFSLMVIDDSSLLTNFISLNSKVAPNSGVKMLLFVIIESFVLLVIGVILSAFVPSKAERFNKHVLNNIRNNWNIAGHNISAFLEKTFKDHQYHLLMVGLFFLLSVGSMLLMNTSLQIEPSTTESYNIFMYTFFARFSMIVFNFLVILAIYYIFELIFKSFWVSLNITSSLVIIFTVANLIKIKTRVEPILPSEISMVTAIGSLLGMISPIIVVGIVVFILAIIVVTVWLEISYPVKKGRFIFRLIRAIGAVIFLLSSLFLNHQNSIPQKISTSFGNQAMFYNQALGAQLNGPLVQFLNNVDVKVMNEPKNYSEKTVTSIIKKYENKANFYNESHNVKMKDQTVIFNLSESFSDPMRVPNVTLNKDPMPYIRSLKKENTSGLMMSSGYGGGTANMEYEALTGFPMSNFYATLPTPYTQLVTSLKRDPSIANAFPYAAAIHPYIGVYYNRQAVYKKFGFNTFSYLGSEIPIKHQMKIGKNPYLSDKTAYLNTLDQINSRKGGQFINLVTMQNHYPYDKDYYKKVEFKANGTALNSENAIKSAENFSQGLYYTDAAVKEFKEELDKIKKPITWVWYGDHLPGIYSGNNLMKYGLEMHQTDYFIYNNKYAREHNKIVKQKNSSYIGTNDFIPMLYQQVNAEITPYVALLRDVHRELPAMSLDSFSNTNNVYNEDGQFVNQHGKVVDKLTKKQKEVLNELRIIQYDVTAGKQYSVSKQFFK